MSDEAAKLEADQLLNEIKSLLTVIKDNLGKLCTALRYQTWNSWHVAVGGATDMAVRLYQVHNNVKIGDLVVEVTSVGDKRIPDSIAVGYLKSITHEPMPVSGWDEAFEGGPPPEEQVFYIKTFDDVEVRWTNCKFIKVADQHIPIV